jgi:stage II sporulation protein D
MYRVVALCLLLLGLDAAAVETVRISMGEPSNPVSVTLSGRQLTFGRDSEEATFTILEDSKVEVSLEDGHLELNGAPVVEGAVRLRAGAEASDAGIPGRESLVVSGGMKVRGDVVVRAHRGKLQLINVITLEDYLEAVLGGEMPASFPVEALKAQAVAARTYALFKKLESVGQPFHMGASVLDQVYGGVRRETARTREAVEATRGQVLTFDLAPLEAYFHASCGGRTESGADALSRNLPYLRSVECPCGSLPASHWSMILPLSELGAGHDGVAVVSRSPTGRARKVRLGTARVVDAVTFRQRLGYGRVKSLAFEVEVDRGHRAVKLSGRGFGHGAGLCQWGAKALADQGWDYQRILSHYYVGAELQHLY